MALIADSGAIYGLHDRDDRHHRALRKFIVRQNDTVLIPAAILSEIDYLLWSKLGRRAELDFLHDIVTGVFTIEPFTTQDATRSRDLMNQYAALDIGLADASVISAAHRLQVRRILTVDERHFRAVRAHDGKPFTLLPADA
jgi:predicted nucleic acid-binding protein